MNTKVLGLASLLTLSGYAIAARAGEESAWGAVQPADAARVVVAAVREEALRNARRCPAARLRGDAMTDAYVRRAAAAARQLLPEQAVAGFLIGLGIALDDSTVLRNNPLTAELCRQAESDG